MTDSPNEILAAAEEGERRLTEVAEASALPLPETLVTIRVSRSPALPSPSTYIVEATPDEEQRQPSNSPEIKIL